MQRLLPDSLGRILHESLHRRMLNFHQEHNPGLDNAEMVIHSKLMRFYNGDPSIIIMVYLDKDSYRINSHALIEIQDFYGERVVQVQQLEYDKKYTDSFNECMEFVDKLVIETNSKCAFILVSKNIKVYEKKYGYKVSQTLMVRNPLCKEEG
jgi:GTPase SAR1 family protein